MPRQPQFFIEFKQTIEFAFNQVAGVSHRDFNRLYDYDDFLEGEAVHCRTARELAIVFAVRFLGAVNPAYLRTLSFALVRFLARQSGRGVEEADHQAIKDLAEIEHEDPKQIELWIDAYFRDVL